MEINLTTLEGTPYVLLTNDSNLTPFALQSGSIIREQEIAELDVVKSLTRESVVLDIGAYIGDTAIIFSESGATVYAFEAQYDAYLASVINSRVRPSVSVFHSAVGNGEIINAGSEAIDGNLGTRGVFESVVGTPTLRIDDFVTSQKIHRIDLIKIDIEGFEMSALRGMEMTLKHYAPKLLIEMYPAMMERYGFSVEGIHEFLSKIGYAWEEVIGNSTEPRWDELCVPV